MTASWKDATRLPAIACKATASNVSVRNGFDQLLLHAILVDAALKINEQSVGAVRVGNFTELGIRRGVDF